MKVICAGVRHQYGKSKKTGKNYDMAAVITLCPIGAAATADYTKIGHGYEMAEIDLRPDAMEQFANLQFPCTVDLMTDMEQRFGRMVPVVVGIHQAGK